MLLLPIICVSPPLTITNSHWPRQQGAHRQVAVIAARHKPFSSWGTDAVMRCWWCRHDDPMHDIYICVYIYIYISRCTYLDVNIYISVLIWYIVGVQCALFPFHSTPKQHSSWNNHDDHADSGSLRIWHTSGYTTKHRHLDTTWIYPTNPSKPKSQCGKLIWK